MARALMRWCLICVVLGLTGTASAFWTTRPAENLSAQRTDGLLSWLDARLDGRIRYKAYEIDVKPGEVWTFDVQSPHFSPYLVVRTDRGQRDAGGNLGVHEAQLTYEARRDERITLWVSTAAFGELGVYSLRAHKREGDAPAVGPQPMHIRSELVANSRVHGEIDAIEDRGPAGIAVHRYEYHGEAGERLVLRASSPQFVPLLMMHGLGVAVHSGDPIGRPREAVLDVTLPESGRYVIRVLSGPTVEDAPYTLSVRQKRAHDGHTPASQRMVLGAHIDGALRPGPRAQDAQPPEDRYWLRLEKGQRVHLHLGADDLDATLQVRMPDKDAKHGAYEDPHRTEEPTPQNGKTLSAAVGESLKFSPPYTGDYEVFVRANNPAVSGSYTLSALRDSDAVDAIFDAQDAQHEGRTLLRAGQNMREQLREDAPQMNDYSYYHAYRLPVEEGQRWTIEMQSLAFDTHLELRGPQGFALANNDRDADSTDSLISFDAPFTGDVTIYATSHLPRALGPFTIHAYEGDPEGDADEADDGRVIALLVGISEYGPKEWAPLPYCAADAVRVGRALETTGTLAPESTILVDAHATRDSLTSALEDAADIVGPNDVFLFFFSGHGGQLPSDDPAERDGLDETLVLYDEQMRDEEFGDLLLNINSRLSIVVLDACYSGGFRDTLRRRKNQIGIFSSEEDVSSFVAEQFEAGGYLSNILVYGLGESADRTPEDGVVTVAELLQYIRTAWGELGQVLGVDSSDHFAHQELVIERGYTSPQEVILRRPPTQR